MLTISALLYGCSTGVENNISYASAINLKVSSKVNSEFRRIVYSEVQNTSDTDFCTFGGVNDYVSLKSPEGEVLSTIIGRQVKYIANNVTRINAQSKRVEEFDNGEFLKQGTEIASYGYRLEYFPCKLLSNIPEDDIGSAYFYVYMLGPLEILSSYGGDLEINFIK